MNIMLKWAWEMDKKVEAPAVYVITDVYAATSNVVTILSKEAEKLLIVNDRNAQEAKKTFPEALVAGESSVLPYKFFNSSNYPFALDVLDVKGKTVLYMSVNGSRVVEKAFEQNPAEVLTVAFCNITAVARYLQTKTDQNIIFIASGNREESVDQVAEEDMLCLYALKKKVDNIDADISQEQQAAEAAVIRHYASKNMNKDIAIVFHSPQSPIVPFCQKQENELLLVRPVSL